MSDRNFWSTRGKPKGVVTTPTPARTRPERRLRGALAILLIALVATAASLAALGSPRAPSSAATRHPTKHHRGTKPKSGKKHSTLTATAIAGATTGKVTRPTASPGCGLALLKKKASIKDPVGHCTILEVGDSLGNDLGWGIERHVSTSSGLNFVQKDVSSTGLTNASGVNWTATLASEVQQYHPNLVLISLGGNDQQGILVGGNAVQFPTAAWQHAYLGRVEQLVRIAASKGAYVMWVGLPIMEQPSYSSGTAILDKLYKQGTTAVPNATFLSTWSLLANPQGAFQTNASVNGTSTTLRESDGIHYSFAGEDVMATYVLRKLATIYHLAFAPSAPATITSWG